MENSDIIEKLYTVVKFEYEWHRVYIQYDKYYTSMDDIGKVYDDLLEALYQSYFGEELGLLLCEYITNTIYDCIYDYKSVSETVNIVYSMYWPDPEKVIAELEEDYRKQEEEYKAKMEEVYKERNEKLDEVCYKTGMSTQEIFELFM